MSNKFQPGTYQWQVDNGNGYTNLSNSAIYSGVNDDTLQVTGAPSSYATYQYRCINTVGAAKDTSSVYELHFANRWTGAVSTAWENAGNWSCGFLPDANTDVVIYPGVPNFPVVNSNVICRSIKSLIRTSINVKDGFTITLTGK